MLEFIMHKGNKPSLQTFFPLSKRYIFLSITFAAETFFIWQLIPSLIPKSTDVVGGIILFDYPNLKYLAFWIIFTALVLPTFPIQSRFLARRFKSFDKGEKLLEEKISSKEEKVLNVYEDETTFLCQLLAWAIFLLVITKFSLVFLSLNYVNIFAIPDNSVFVSDLAAISLFLAFGTVPIIISTWRRNSIVSENYKRIFLFQNLVPFFVLATIFAASLRSIRKLGLEQQVFKTYIAFALIFLVVTCLILFNLRSSPNALKSSLLSISLPAFFVLAISDIPSSLASSKLDPFESFSFVNVQLFNNFGFLPWRDLLFTHGVYEDFIRPYLGSQFFGSTTWGMQAGISAVIGPIEFLLCYLCLYRIFRGNLAVILGVSLFALTQGLFPTLLPNADASLLIPATLLPRSLPILFLVLIYNHRFKNIFTKKFFYTLVLTLTLISTPEGSYVFIALITTTIFHDFYLYRINDSLRNKMGVFKPLRNSTEALVSIFLSLILTYTFLYIFGLDSFFISQFLYNSSGYLFQGGGPIAWGLGIAFVGCIFLAILASCLPILSISRGILFKEELTQLDFAILIPTFVGHIFFLKFLLWPDWHILQVLAVLTIPIFFYLEKLFGYPSKLNSSNYLYFGRLVRKEPVLKILILTLPIAYSLMQVPDMTSRIAPLLPSFADKQIDPNHGSIDEPTRQRIERMSEIAKKVRSLTGMRDPKVFDFTSSPFEIHGLGGLKPLPNLLFASTIFSTATQEKYLELLKKDPPDLVIWKGEVGFFNALPGALYLRTPLLSKYVLENYEPMDFDGDYVFMTPKDSNSTLNSNRQFITKDIVGSDDCDWANALTRYVYPFALMTEKHSMSLTDVVMTRISIKSNVPGSLELQDTFGNIVATLTPKTGSSDSINTSVLLPEKIWESVKYLTVNGTRVNFSQGSKVLSSEYMINIEAKKYISKEFKFWISNLPVGISGLQFDGLQKNSTYQLSLIGSSGVTKFNVDKNTSQIRVPVANCPSFRPNSLDLKKGYMTVMIQKPRNDVNSHMSLLYDSN
jgi:hypothetical protein